MMKKITLLLMFLIASISLNAQIWDFTNDNGGWEGKAGGTLTVGATASNFAWVTDNKPKMFQTTANVDADVNKVFSITIKNNTEITELKLKHLKPDATKRYVALSIDANLDEFKTYYFDLTNSNWVGIQNEMDFIFSVGGNNTTSDASIEVDQVGFIESIPTTEKHEFHFATNDDLEGFEEKNVNSVVVSGGILTMDTKVDGYSNMKQVEHHLDASSYGTLEIEIKNNSTNDDTFFFVFPDGTTKELTISTSDTDFKLYQMDLKGNAIWTGEVLNYKIRFGDADRVNPNDNTKFGVSSGTGTIEIDRITFTNQILATDDVGFKDDVNISLYPNPVSHILSIHSPKVINKVEVFNYLGQRTISKTDSLKALNISGLTNGVYILKIYQEGNIVSTKRFIKE